MTASLRHPNVVEVAGWGSDKDGSYLAVELVQGVSLMRLMKTVFETGEAFSERMIVYLGACVCRGLAAAHALRAPNGEILSLVHRDLTPGNVLLGFQGEVKIADFGMAKAKQRLTKTLTGQRKGEPTYMAPEQAQVDDIDARADLFSLGVMLFELFAGRRPWEAKSDFEMVQAMLSTPPSDLAELRPKIDRELVRVVMRCLEKNPAARFQSAHEVADKLDEWLELHGYQEGNADALGRFVRRNAMRQMRWFERAIAGGMAPAAARSDAPPRVPTYTEHTHAPSRRPSHAPADRAPQRVSIPAPPPPPALGPRKPQVPLVPPRAAAGPVDPRALRAQNVVEQLKKLAPAPEPPRPKKGLPRLHDGDDGDETDVELRLSQRPSMPAPADDDDDEPIAEEAPTLVQKDAKIAAARAEARRAAQIRNARELPLLVDEDSDQQVTAVNRAKQRAAMAALPILDHDSELPTEPVQAKNAAHALPRLPPIPPAPPAPPPPARPPVETPRPAPAAPGPPSISSSAVLSLDAGRASQADDVQVIDRNVLRQQVLHTAEGIVAESDRLAIEAVRRGEEARAAQVRAERKAAAAKVAADAARIAAEAVQMIRTAGIAVAARKLEEAHALEQGNASGRYQAGQVPDLRASGGGSVFPPVSVPYPSSADAAFPGVDAARAMAIGGAGVASGSMPPPPPSAIPPPVVPGVPPSHDPSRPSLTPPLPTPILAALPAPLPIPSPPAHAFDPDLLVRRDPTIFGLAPSAVAGLSVVVVFLVIVLAVYLAR
jgi:serine/threonine-protein kinase